MGIESDLEKREVQMAVYLATLRISLAGLALWRTIVMLR